MSATDDRKTRSDNRSNHLSAAEITRRASGPVITLTPEQIAAMDPSKPTDTKPPPIDYGKEQLEARAKLSFPEQAEAIRRANSILTSDVLLAIEKGSRDPDTIALHKHCASVAKSFMAEERQGGDGRDPSQMTDAEIAKKLGR